MILMFIQKYQIDTTIKFKQSLKIFLFNLHS